MAYVAVPFEGPESGLAHSLGAVVAMLDYAVGTLVRYGEPETAKQLTSAAVQVERVRLGVAE